MLRGQNHGELASRLYTYTYFKEQNRTGNTTKPNVGKRHQAAINDRRAGNSNRTSRHSSIFLLAANLN